MIEFLEYFSCQVIEYELWRRCHRQGSGRAGSGCLVEHEDESRRPPLCLLVYLTEAGVVDVGAPELDDGVGLIPCQTQIVPTEHLQRLVRPQTHHARWRFRAADDDDAAVGRQLRHGVENRRVKRRLR